jgi:cobalt/nickel transport system permease protein
LHHVVLERWSRGDSFLHRRDPRGKIVVLIAFLAAVATTPPRSALWLPAYAVLPLAAILAARLPLAGALIRAGAVLPFCAVFVLFPLLSGDTARAAAFAEKSYVSALAAIALAGSTPMPALAAGLGSLRAPRFLVLVIQFLYRYLFVVSEQSQHMRLAAASRAARSGLRFRRWRLRAATGALTFLFAKSYLRAEATYRAMLARSFTGRLHLVEMARFNAMDAAFLVLGVMGPLAFRFLILRMP